jgi:uncharacterized SAM-binding protein YcdF (DUF218 family)
MIGHHDDTAGDQAAKPGLTIPAGRGGRRLLARFLLGVVGAGCALWLGGLVWFAETIPHEATDLGGRTDAIVVLTGGSERLATGLELLSSGLARKLFVSGVSRGVDVEALLHAAHLPPGEAECCIVLGHAADNTIGNAAETMAWMRREGFRSLRLVTANYHMRRSLLEFRIAGADVVVVPHPVAPAAVRLEDWWRWPGTASLIVTEFDKYLLALARAVINMLGAR